MRKVFLICAIFAFTASFAAKAAYQYFVACGKVHAIDARASNAEVLYWMDVIESNC